jgi:hypothetical protein
MKLIFEQGHPIPFFNKTLDDIELGFFPGLEAFRVV